MTTEQSLKEEIDLFMAGNKTTMRVRELCPVLKNWRNAKQLSDRIPPLVNALHDKHSKSKCVSIYCFHFKLILIKQGMSILKLTLLNSKSSKSDSIRISLLRILC